MGPVTGDFGGGDEGRDEGAGSWDGGCFDGAGVGGGVGVAGAVGGAGCRGGGGRCVGCAGGVVVLSG